MFEAQHGPPKSGTSVSFWHAHFEIKASSDDFVFSSIPFGGDAVSIQHHDV